MRGSCLRGNDGEIRVNDACNQCTGWLGGGAMGSCRLVGVGAPKQGYEVGGFINEVQHQTKVLAWAAGSSPGRPGTLAVRQIAQIAKVGIQLVVQTG